MKRVIFVLLDGLRLGTAQDCLGYVQAQAAADDVRCIPVTAELPSLSRPLYETLMTGVAPVDSGITGNMIVRNSMHPGVFDRCIRAGHTTAAAAYHWFSELYNHAPFDPAHRLTDNPNAAIQHGLFYWRDGYPDDHLFADAEGLRRRYAPHFLLVHSMGIDHAGHQHGGGGVEYRAAARGADALLAQLMPTWLREGYAVVVTSDHGMGDDGAHGGPGVDETRVPFWLFGAGPTPTGVTLRQTEIAGTVCALLGVSCESISVNDQLAPRP